MSKKDNRFKSVEYKPFGEEWKAQLMKLTKGEIVELYRTLCISNLSALESQKEKP